MHTNGLYMVLKVARDSVKEQVFDVGHLEAVKLRLKTLLISELTPISEMVHASAHTVRSLDEEGGYLALLFKHAILCTLTTITFSVACNVGDWVEVTCDYSPGVCSEGGTGVVIAKAEGTRQF
jgi:hypothetical protein